MIAAASRAVPAHLLANGQHVSAGDELDADVALLRKLVAVQAKAAQEKPDPTQNVQEDCPCWLADFTYKRSFFARMAVNPHKTAKKLVDCMSNDQLNAWRTIMGFSVKEAAFALGITQNAYRDLEKGKAIASKRTALACAAIYLGAEKIAKPWLH